MGQNGKTSDNNYGLEIEHAFKNINLLENALTHKSYSNENIEVKEDNQRLEYLGDAVLGLVVAEALMEKLPSAPEGILTERRATLVNEGSLAELARHIDLGRALRLGRGEEISNGRDRSSTLADALEAVVGAVYLDGGFDAAKQVVLSWLSSRIDEATDREIGGDVKGALQRALQEQGLELPVYEMIKEEGPDHAKVFEIALISKGNTLAIGRGRSKKEAEKNAAARALQDMRSK